MKIGYTEAIHYTQKGKQIEVVNNLYRTLFLILGVIILSLPQALSNESEFLQFWDGITSGNALLIILSFFSSYGIGLLLQIGLIVIFSSIYIMRNVRLLDKEAVFLGIDEGEEGLWLQTYRYRSPIYIPFTCLEKLDFTAKKIVLSYKQAFILKGEQNGDVTVLSGKRHTFSYQGLNIADVPTFIKSCNQCLPKDKKQTFPEIVVDKSRNKMKFLFTLGLIFSMVISFNFAKDLPYLIVSKMENRTQETSALKAGTTFTTRNFKFKVKKALKANTDHDTQIGIVQFEIAPKKTDTTPIWLNQMDFSIVADKKKYQIFKNNYNWVLGVSKNFNPEVCVDINGKPNPGFIADLPLYHRTPVACFKNPDWFGDTEFAVWYVRIRDKQRTRTPFDGIIKVEKILVTQEETDDGIDSTLVDQLSAYLINERNPVCYGSDLRWANHLYPIYLTETYVKSKYLSAESFLHLF